MRAACYFDENCARIELIEALSAARFETLRAVDAGTGTWPDEQQLEFAAVRELVLVTSDTDFLRLHARWMRDARRHSGIVYIEQKRISPGVSIRRMLRLLQARSAEDLANRVEFLSNWD